MKDLRRKLLAAWRLLRSRGYILCTIHDDPSHINYDHNVCEEDVIYYNGYLNALYEGEVDALRKAKEILQKH